MTLAVKPGFAPMEARVVATLPVGPEWQYEPKWDGFRCLAFKDGTQVALMSKSGQPPLMRVSASPYMASI